MATVSYNAVHTPYQQPPPDLYPPGFVWPATIPEDCGNVAAQHILSQLMLAAMDREIGRLLAEIGLANIGDRGQLHYRPELTDTMIVIAGDNGTYVPAVQLPYDPLRSKGSPYETGISTPLIVSGPLVRTDDESAQSPVSDQLCHQGGWSLSRPGNLGDPGLVHPRSSVQVGEAGEGPV
jgi:arylsulfatase A-like enzyme